MGTRSATTLEEFKQRLPLAEIVGRYVRLTRRGREHQGLCPFHDEKTPSFSVVEDKGFYHCFGCGAHGTAIDFIMNIDGLSFAEALDRLSEMTGVPAPNRAVREDPQLRERTIALRKLLAFAADWYEDALLRAHGRSARLYLESRGIDGETRSSFKLGYAPTGNGLAAALRANGMDPALGVEAGLLAVSEERGEAYDRFRDRIIFPINDARGSIVGFGGRALGDTRPKYLNSPETPLFQKGRLLFGLDKAARPARQKSTVIVVEGYFDVITLSAAGIDQAVAPLGTAVSEEQLALLWRFADEPLICLDGDDAGLGAAIRLTRRALPLMRDGRSLRFLLLPSGEDPDSFVRRRGQGAFKDLAANAIPLSRLILETEQRVGPLETAEQVSGLRARLAAYVRLATDPELRAGLHTQFDEAVRTHRWNLRRRPAGRSMASARATEASPGRGEGPLANAAALRTLVSTTALERERALLMAFVDEPLLLKEHDEALADLEIADPLHEELRAELLAWYAAASDLDATDLGDHLLTHGSERLQELLRGSKMAGLTVKRGSKGDQLAAATLMVRDLLRRAAVDRERTDLAQELRNGFEDALGERRRALDSLLNRQGEPEVSSIRSVRRNGS